MAVPAAVVPFAWLVLVLLAWDTTTTAAAVTTGLSACSFQHRQDGVHADCRGRNLTSLPRTVTWPRHVVRLDLSGNGVTKLGHADLDQPELRGLRHLDLSDNRLEGRLGNGSFVAVPGLKVRFLGVSCSVPRYLISQKPLRQRDWHTTTDCQKRVPNFRSARVL